jgi:hypothetical protein
MAKDNSKYGRTFEYKYSYFGSDTYGHDLKVYGDTTGTYMSWDASTGIFAIAETLAASPGATVIPFNVTINHSAGAGDCDDLVSGYFKANVTGAGDSGLTAVANASRMYVGAAGTDTTVISQAYGTQAWAKHYGTGAITAMSGLSALVDVNTGNFTASTINAGHFHIEGEATVTAQFDGVMIEVYPDVTCLDSCLALMVDGAATVGAAIRLSGTTTDFLKFAATGSCGATTSDPSVGSANTWIQCHIGATIFWLIGYADQ